MDLQPSGNNVGNSIKEITKSIEEIEFDNELITVETKDVLLVIKGQNFGIADLDTIIIDTYDKAAEINYNKRLYLKEYSNYEVIIKSKNNANVEFYHENINIRNKITPITKKSKDLSGIINFRGDIGFTDIYIKVNNECRISCRLEVYPSKISYKEDYEAILRDVNDEIYNLAYGFLARTYLGAEINNRTNSCGTEFYSILNYVFDKLIKAVDIVLCNPHHELRKKSNIVKYHAIKKVTNETIKWIEKRPDIIRKVHGRYIPTEALQIEKHITLNTKENRLLKYILIRIKFQIKNFIRSYKNINVSSLRGEKSQDLLLIDQLHKFNKEITIRLNTPLFRNITAKYNEAYLSLVFTMGSGYKEIYKYYLMLQKGLCLKSNIFSISIKEISLLYEYWCFIKIGSILQKKYKLITSDLLKINRNGIIVSLKKGIQSSITYENAKTKEQFTIYYNSSRSSKTVSQKPDNILSMYKDGSSKAYEFIFDAKYKVDDTEIYKKIHGTTGPKEEDINTMHRYRDAIVFNSKENYRLVTNKNCIFGAFVLFPYNNEEEFKKNDFYKSIEEVNIGAIPFLPSSTKLMERFLDELINESAYSNFERAIESIGREEYLKEEYFNNRNVLVGSLKSKEQLEVNLNKKFYHIPKKSINLGIHSIEYVALVQSKKEFGHEAGVYYYGKINEIKILKRSEITDIPKLSEEIYYRFEIEEWKKLDRKIKVEGQSIRNIIYTSKYLLENSLTITELFIKSKDEFRLWKELKRLSDDGATKVTNKEGNISGISISGIDIIVKDDEIKAIIGDRVINIKRDELLRKPRWSIKRIIECKNNSGLKANPNILINK